MILPAQHIRQLCRHGGLITPWTEETQRCFEINGREVRLSSGISVAGYDIRLDDQVLLDRYSPFRLGSSLERFKMPNDLLGHVCDKSSWARRGLRVQNTIIEPGWEGWLTLEMDWVGRDRLVLPAGVPIAQVVFHLLSEPTEQPYRGKYQHQGRGPQEAL